MNFLNPAGLLVGDDGDGGDDWSSSKENRSTDVMQEREPVSSTRDRPWAKHVLIIM